MPANKNADIRYHILDRCLSNQFRQYEIGDLVEAVNSKLYDLTGSTVSLRQIREDLRYLRDSAGYDAPIVAIPFAGKRCFYQYQDPGFSIYKTEVSEEVVQALRNTINLLGRYRGIPANAWLEEVISNLEVNLGVKPTSDACVSFEQNQQLIGLQHLSPLIDHTINRHPIFISYQPYGKESRQWTIHPYHVKQYNNRWYLWGYCEQQDRIVNLALDRIDTIRPTPADTTFRPNSDIDFKTFFDDFIGVTNPGPDIDKVEIRLRFSNPVRYRLVVSKPIHHSQQTVSDTDISLTLKPNKELRSKIFELGDDVEVLSPQWLRQEFAEIFSKIAQKYLSVKNPCTDPS